MIKINRRAFAAGSAALALAPRMASAQNKKLLRFVFDDPAVYAWGGESILIDGHSVGELSSAGHSPAAGACVALGYVRGPAAQQVIEHRARH